MSNQVLRTAKLVSRTRCPVCQSKELQPLGKLSYAQPITFATTLVHLPVQPKLFKCTSCKALLTSPVIAPEEMISLYQESQPRWDVHKDIQSFSKRELLEYYAPSGFESILDNLTGRRVLDIGCHTGKLLDLFQLVGWKTYGVEPSVQAATIASLHHKVLIGSFERAEEFQEVFDVIICFDMIEHLYNPADILYLSKKVLAPDGILLILTGNCESYWAHLQKNEFWYYQYPEHITFLGPQSINRLAQICQFRVSKVEKVCVSPISTQSLITIFIQYVASKIRGEKLLRLPARDHFLSQLQFL